MMGVEMIFITWILCCCPEIDQKNMFSCWIAAIPKSIQIDFCRLGLSAVIPASLVQSGEPSISLGRSELRAT
jgi:hypothetical protein